MDLSQYIPNLQEQHAIVAHLPIALSALGVLIVVVSLLIKTSRDMLRWVAVASYCLLAATAYAAVRTGEDARTEVSGSLPIAIWETVEHHQWMAEYVWMFGMGTAALMGISIIATSGLRHATGLLGLALSIATAVWVGLTGHDGGTLVYEHGIGIPPDQVVEWRINPPPSKDGTVRATMPDSDRILIPIFDIDPVEAAKISWIRDVVPIFEEVCNECHTPGDLDSELDMTTVAGLIKGGEKYGTSIVPFKPDESTTIQYVRGELQPQMPEDEMPLLKEEVHILRQWIFAGAIDDSQ